MEVKRRAFEVAKEFHDGKVRKAEPEKDFILHPISVASKLYRTGFSDDDNVIVAALLHDVVESTSCTREFIYKEFGNDIGSLVDSVSEKDPNLPWKVRKQETITKLKFLDLRHKIIKGADAWDNTEDLMIKFGKSGIRDFSSFNSGPDKKLWYWKGLYDSLVYGQDQDIIAFSNFKDNIDTIFGGEQFEELDELGKLYYKKLELYKLQDVINTINMLNGIKEEKKSYVVGIFDSSNGLSEAIYNYFMASGFRIKLISLDISNLKNKRVDNIENEINKYSSLFGYDIILIDGNLPLLYKKYLDSELNADEYYSYFNYFMWEIGSMFDKLVGLNCARNITSLDNTNVGNPSLIDTSIFIGNEIVNDMKNKYLKDIKVKIRK